MLKKSISGILMAAMTVAFCSCHRPSGAMQRIDAVIASGDTVRTDGLTNLFVTFGAKPSDAMLATDLVATLDRASSLDKPDSYFCFVMHHTDSVTVSSNKAVIAALFPDAEEITVDGESATRAEFDRIPASLIVSVTAEDGGRRLAVTTRDNVNAPMDKAVSDVIAAEQAWFDRSRTGEE